MASYRGDFILGDHHIKLGKKQVVVSTPSISGYGRADRRWRWYLLMPAVLAVVVLLFVPVLWTLGAAFTDIHLFRIGVPTRFTGLKNFTKLLGSGYFWTTLRNTVVFVITAVPAEICVGLAVAVSLNNIARGRKFFRTLFLLPMMLSPVIVSVVIGRMLFKEDTGPINDFLTTLGFKGIPWLTDGNWAMAAIILVDIWHSSAFMILMITAGLQSIPPDLLEAASVDGADGLQGFRLITLPLLAPVLVTAVLIRSLDAFKVADSIFVMTGGGPGQATESVSLAIFRTGIKGGDLAFGSSQAYILLVIMLVFGGGFLFMSRRAVGRQ